MNRFEPRKPKKWFTCAPLRFKGNELFFSRDSGLLCKGFQKLGYESKAILPGPPMQDDHEDDLIRTDFANLEDPSWWRELGGEGVVFYGWGSGKYVRIARAIKGAGLILVSHMDTYGLISILNGPIKYGGSIWRVSRGANGGVSRSIISFIRKYMYSATFGLAVTDYRRACHLREADCIGAITPIALKRIGHVCRYYGGCDLAERVALIPHPVPDYMNYSENIAKEVLVVAIGRWNDERIKGTRLLADSVSCLLSKDASVRIEVYGELPQSLILWYETLDHHCRSRVFLKGRQSNKNLRHALQRASVSLCTSMCESFHIASAEALCSGASVVGPDLGELPGMQWFTDGEFGTLAPRTPEGLAEGLCKELKAWQEGRRDPRAISDFWSGQLHAPNVAKRILSQFAKLKDSGTRETEILESLSS